MRVKLILGGVGAVVVALLLLEGGVVEAKKMKPPPEPPPQVDTGTVYYVAGSVYAMQPDGSGKTELIPAGGGIEPSAKLHPCATHTKNERWFLQIRPVGSSTYPSGIARHELFAVCEGGTAIQLTSDPDLEPDSTGMASAPQWSVCRPHWVENDTVVSYLAKRWSGDTVVAWGIHVLSIQPDSLSAHVPAVPARVPVTLDLLSADQWHGGRMNAAYDWKPDGTAIVHQRWSGSYSLVRADYIDGNWSTTPLLSFTQCPLPRSVRWSPAASRILFVSNGGIDRMDPYAPSSRTTILDDPRDPKKGKIYLAKPKWSPNGTHIVYRWISEGRSSSYSDVRRAAADGGDDTNLTDDLSGHAVPIGWR